MNLDNGSVASVLKGYKIMELSTLISGPYCSSLLGDLGADVIKVELPKIGDISRHVGNVVNGESVLFLGVNRNKKSMTLALTKPEGIEILDRLILQTDVIIENFRPDIREQYGLDYDRVKKMKPDMIYLSYTAFGEDGPYRFKPGTDHVFQALSGIMNLSGQSGQGPVRMGVAIADLTAALYGAFGVMTALLNREKTGEGQLLSINLLDVAMCLQGSQIAEYFLTGEEPVQYGNDSPFAYPVGVFRTADGHIAISAYHDKFFQSLCTAMNLDELVKDPRFETMETRFHKRDDLRPILEEKFPDKSTADWLSILEKEDIPCGPVQNYNALFEDPQVLVNQLVKELPHARLDKAKVIGSPLRFSRTPINHATAAPLLGEHTDGVLSELGYSDSEIQALRTNKII